MGLLTVRDLLPPELRSFTDALASGDPDRVARLYAPSALLLATLEAPPRAGRAEIRGYFARLMADKPGLRVEWQQTFRPRPGVTAGFYTFRWHGGSAPARFTIVEGPSGIQHHHSSVLPA